MSTISPQAIEDSLKQCMDPEVPLNIVEMGLIYGIDVAENNDVNIKMTMTTQGRPHHETLSVVLFNQKSLILIIYEIFILDILPFLI